MNYLLGIAFLVGVLLLLPGACGVMLDPRSPNLFLTVGLIITYTTLALSVFYNVHKANRMARRREAVHAGLGDLDKQDQDFGNLALRAAIFLLGSYMLLPVLFVLPITPHIFDDIELAGIWLLGIAITAGGAVLIRFALRLPARGR